MYTQPGQPPTRGFGGRLYFYNAKDKTVPVEGQLVVYAYDDSADGTPAKSPSRKFGFTPEQFTQHYSPTELGASDSVWIPWDELGGVRKSITLLPVFTSSSGQVVMGEQSINVLPGKAPENPEPARQGYFAPLSSNEPQGVRPSRRPAKAPPSPADSWQQTHTFEPNTTNQPQLVDDHPAADEHDQATGPASRNARRPAERRRRHQCDRAGAQADRRRTSTLWLRRRGNRQCRRHLQLVSYVRDPRLQKHQPRDQIPFVLRRHRAPQDRNLPLHFHLHRTRILQLGDSGQMVLDAQIGAGSDGGGRRGEGHAVGPTARARATAGAGETWR